MVRNPEILILDDSFSALDYVTDARLREAIAKSCKDTTVIIVSQRANTIKNADRIVVLEDGKIVGLGRHDELYAGCSIYREICDANSVTNSVSESVISESGTVQGTESDTDMMVPDTESVTGNEVAE